MPPPVINIAIHKLNNRQFRHITADHPISSRIFELARALAARDDSVDGVVTPDELLPSHASFIAILNATTTALQHCGLHLSRLDPVSRQRTLCFSINLNQRVVKDVSHDCENIVDFPLPVGEDVQRELRDFIIEQVNEWRRQEESRRQEEEAKRQQEQERRSENAIAFLRRLVELDLVGPEVLGRDAPANTCPLCSRNLVRCRVCGVHACENSTCQSFSVVSVVACSYHNREFFCVPCTTDHSPSAVGQCPICSHWYCMELLSGCVGRPEGVQVVQYNRNPNELFYPIRDLGKEDNHQPLNHAHPPRIAPCRECVREGRAPTWRHCNNTHCWSRSRKHMAGMVCPDCAPGGHTCACSGTWVCELCPADLSGTPFVQCPGCMVVYCRDWCAYIQTCAICSSTRLCDDCIEEEPEVNAEQPQLRSLLFTEKCRICRCHICDTCAPHMATCSSCDYSYCGRCKWTDVGFSCKSCSAPMCKDCIRNWDDCRECIDAKYPRSVIYGVGERD